MLTYSAIPLKIGTYRCKAYMPLAVKELSKTWSYTCRNAIGCLTTRNPHPH